jgi:hypothetical protein
LAVSILRAIRHTCADKQAGVIYIYTTSEVIAYMLNYKKADIVSTEKNYNVHIFMHPSEDVGSNGFNIKKRKGLSDDEKRELEMQVTTGKVNQLELEKSYFENYREEQRPDDSQDKGDRRKFHNNDKFKKHHHRDKRKYHDQRNQNQQPKKKSFLGSLFSKD